MTPVLGGWDNYTKEVTGIIDISGWIPGTYYIYVYGGDSCGNNRTDVATYAILYLDNKGPAIEGPWAESTLSRAMNPIYRKNPYVFTSATSFVIMGYGDDRLRGRSIVIGAEYFIDENIGANGTGFVMKNVGFRFDSPYEGAYATILCSNWTAGEFHVYHIHFQDAMGEWGDWGTVLVMKQGPEFRIPIHVGWNLISLPLITASSDIEDILSDISWDRAFIYDSSEPNPWLSNRLGGPAELNDFTAVTTSVGIWVHVTAIGDGNLDISGGLPGTVQINLYAGWNLVGYPSMTNRTASVALAGTGADMIAIFDIASPSFMQDIMAADLSTVIMAPGMGYWIHVPFDTVWTVNP